MLINDTTNFTDGDFLCKLGGVSHHLIDASGNAGSIIRENSGDLVLNADVNEPYSRDVYEQTQSQGFPHINIAQSTNQVRMNVKFFVPRNTNVWYYLWNFGDGTTLKTISSEIEHKYNLLTKSTWLTYSGQLPIIGLRRYTGRWTNVTLTIFYRQWIDSDVSSLDIVGDNGSASVNVKQACVYEITGEAYAGLQDSYDNADLVWQDTYDNLNPPYQDNY